MHIVSLYEHKLPSLCDLVWGICTQYFYFFNQIQKIEWFITIWKVLMTSKTIDHKKISVGTSFHPTFWHIFAFFLVEKLFLFVLWSNWMSICQRSRMCDLCMYIYMEIFLFSIFSLEFNYFDLYLIFYYCFAKNNTIGRN